MNIDEITTKRLGGCPQAERVPDGFPIGQQPSKPCDHDWIFLRGTQIVERDKPLSHEDVFFCRRCLEKREVKR